MIIEIIATVTATTSITNWAVASALAPLYFTIPLTGAVSPSFTNSLNQPHLTSQSPGEEKGEMALTPWKSA